MMNINEILLYFQVRSKNKIYLYLPELYLTSSPQLICRCWTEKMKFLVNSKSHQFHYQFSHVGRFYIPDTTHSLPYEL